MSLALTNGVPLREKLAGLGDVAGSALKFLSTPTGQGLGVAASIAPAVLQTKMLADESAKQKARELAEKSAVFSMLAGLATRFGGSAAGQALAGSTGTALSNGANIAAGAAGTAANLHAMRQAQAPTQQLQADQPPATTGRTVTAGLTQTPTGVLGTPEPMTPPRAMGAMATGTLSSGAKPATPKAPKATGKPLMTRVAALLPLAPKRSLKDRLKDFGAGALDAADSQAENLLRPGPAFPLPGHTDLRTLQ